MSPRRRSSFRSLWCCDRSQPVQSEKSLLDLPPGIPPRRTMELSTSDFINVYPNNRDIKIKLNLQARIDTGLQQSILSESAVQLNGATMRSSPQNRVRDSAGLEYECIGIIPSTWRVSNQHTSVAEDFAVTRDDLPPGFAVLLAPSKKNVRSGGSKTKDSKLIAPLFHRESEKKLTQAANTMTQVQKDEAEAKRKAKAAQMQKLNDEAQNGAKPNNGNNS